MRGAQVLPPRLTRTTVKALNMDTMPPIAPTRVLFMCTLTKHKQRQCLSAQPMCDDLHCWRTRHVASNQHPQKTIPSPKSQKNLAFMDYQNKEPPNPMFPKVAETDQPIWVLHIVCIEVNAEAGAG